MNQFYDINPDLLVKYLLNEASPAECEQAEQWINASSANRKQFDDFRLIWETSGKLAASSTVDEEESWQRFRQRIHLPAVAVAKGGDALPHSAVIKSLPRRLSALRVAAVLVMAVGAGWLLHQLFSPVPVLSVQSYAAVLRDTLSDGSVVTLNKNSSLSYPARFTGDTRSIGLHGEAFFNVAPDKKKPFVIRVNDVTIKVVGTSFNVRSSGAHTEVIVETGIVQVSRSRHTVELHPHEQVSVAPGDSTMTTAAVTDKLYNYYRSKEFVCNNTPLWKLAEVLEEAYGVKIVFARKELRSLPITTNFEDQSLDTILTVITKTFNISYEKTASQVIIK